MKNKIRLKIKSMKQKINEKIMKKMKIRNTKIK